MWAELFSPGMPAFLTKFPRYVQVDITSSSGESNHRRWFSWCESRMRLLIRGVEMPTLIFCHPMANCYHRKLDENGAAAEPAATAAAAVAGEKYSSSFFMGLTFANGLRSVDLTSTIQDFVYRVSIFDGKTRDMNVDITALQATALPDFALGMYEDTASDKMTPLKTPVRPPLPGAGAGGGLPSLAVPASAMSIDGYPADADTDSDLAIAPSMGAGAGASSGSVSKTLWVDGDEGPNNDSRSDGHMSQQQQPLSMEEEGWVDTQMEIATPVAGETSENISGAGGSDLGNPQSRRRERGSCNETNNPNGRPIPPVPPIAIDSSRPRAMSVDCVCAAADEDKEDDISPYKKSRACIDDNTSKNVTD
jgi:hypothetical protein